jgi:hypothetical protein
MLLCNSSFGQKLIEVSDQEIASATSYNTPVETFMFFIKSTHSFELNCVKDCFTKEKQKEMVTFSPEELESKKEKKPKNYSKIDGYYLNKTPESNVVVYHSTTKTSYNGNEIIRKYIGELSMTKENDLWKIQNFNKMKVKQYLNKDEKN